MDLVKVNARRPQNKDTPTDRGRHTETAANPRAADSKDSKREVGHGHFVLKRIVGRPSNGRCGGSGAKCVPEKTDQSA
jgi:hypothetical protein